MNLEDLKLTSLELMTLSYYVNEYLKEYPYCSDNILKSLEFNNVKLIIDTINSTPVILCYFKTKYPFSKNKYKYITSIIEKDILSMSEEEKELVSNEVKTYREEAFNRYFGINTTKVIQKDLINTLKRIKK